MSVNYFRDMQPANATVMHQRLGSNGLLSL